MSKPKRKVKRFVIDVNTFITIFINHETDWLFQYILKNRLEIFIDDELLTELTKVLNYPKIKKRLELNPVLYISFVRIISTHVVSTNFGINSPDPMDNYLYSLALSVNAKLLITGEKALLHWKETPVETMSLTNFKKIF